MRIKRLSLLMVLITLFLVSVMETQAQSQFSKKKKYWAIGPNFNAVNYFGDIVPKSRIGSFDINFTRPQFGAQVMRRVSPRVFLRGFANWGRFAGDDNTTADPGDTDFAIFRYRRNLHFRTDFVEVGFGGVYDFKENKGTFARRPKGLVPYVHAGIAMLYYKPMARTPTDPNPAYADIPRGVWVDLRQLRTEGVSYSPVTVVIPAGVGVRYALNGHWDVAFEIGYRLTFTDYLDDVSSNYINPFQHDSRLAYVMADRSREAVASWSGNQRDLQQIFGGQPNTVFYDPQTGIPFPDRFYEGYGYPNDIGGIRGDKDRDVYIVYGIQLTYLFGNAVRCPKFR